MSNNKGFTLVELLAVIVILAIIMIIAIPAVLNTLETAKRKTFSEYIDKVATKTQDKYFESQLNNEAVSGAIVYDISADLGFSNVGEFKGYSLIDTNSNNIYITLYNNEYAVYGLLYGKIDDSNIKRVSEYTTDDMSVESLVKKAGIEKYSYFENGTIKSGVVTLTKAILKDGEGVNVILKKFVVPSTSSSWDAVGGIKNITYTQDLSSALDNKTLISSSSSEEPVYAWYDSTTQTVTIGCRNRKVYLNSNSPRLFYALSDLINIDLSHFDTSDCTNLHGLFGMSTKIASLDVSNFNTSKVYDFRAMFQALNKITSLDISNFNFSSATDLSYLFQGCTNLSYVDTLVINSKNVYNLELMFEKTAFTEIDLRNLGTSKVTKFDKMFYKCRNLTKIIVSSDFNFNSMTSDASMFSESTLLPGYNSSQVTSTYASNYLTYI